MKKKLLLAAGVFVGAVVAMPSFAVDKASLLESIRKQAGEYDEFKALLNSPEQNMRVSAFEAMTKSGDKALRELAIESGLASVDAAMQSLALNAVLDDIATLSFKLELPTSPSKEQQTNADKWGMNYAIEMRKRKENGDLGCNAYAKCQVSGLQFSYESGSCRVDASLQNGDSLLGEVSCNRMKPIKAVAILR